jgi:PAS domain S-box-containing protein
MHILLAILFELLFVATLVLLFYSLKQRYGLTPLYILLGSLQYFQTILYKSFFVTIFGEYHIALTATILFCSTLFAILLIYIKEGVQVTRNLILGIVLSNLAFTMLTGFLGFEHKVMKDIINYPGLDPSFFAINIKLFIVGTVTLILDAFIIVILYEYFYVKMKWLISYLRILLTMLIIMNFDAVVFSTGSFWNNDNLSNIIISQVIGKSIAAVFFGTVLYIYLRFINKFLADAGLPGEIGNRDILSILTYQGRFKRLVSEKAMVDKELQSVILDKEKEREKALHRYDVMTSVRDLRIDKFTTAEQAKEFLLKVRSAFEVDACSIHLIEKEELQLLAGIGITEAGKEFKLTITLPYLSKMVKNKQSLCIEDTRIDPMFNLKPADAGNLFKYISCAGAPLLADGEVIGLLKLYSINSIRRFTDLELEHLQGFANQIAYKIEASQLFAQNEKHKEVLIKQIVARKKVEDAIKESEEKYRTLVEQASDGIAISNESLGLEQVNMMICKMLGYSREELLKLSIFDISVTRPADAENRFDELQRGNSVLQERMFKCKDGATIPVEVSTVKMVDGNYLSFVRDITQRKHDEMRNQFLLLRNRQTITSMLDGFLLADDTGRIVETNPAYCRMTGYSNEELLGMNVNEIEATLSQEEFESRIKQMLEKKAVKFETRHRRKDKALIDLEVSISIMDFDEKPLVAAFVRDITERKKAQEQIENYNIQLRKLTAHLQSIREEERRRIGREIHDDLGQQLTAIKMDAAWIDKNTPAEASLKKEKLKNIIALLDGSNTAVRRILSELKPSVLDEYGLLDVLDWQASQFTANTGVPVEMICSQTDIRLSENIATCIFRIFQESLTNITRYAKAKLVISSIKLFDDYIEVNIEDDGIGFDVSKISTRATFGILGMQERVSALSGKFIINSDMGIGTRISFSIPLKQK